MLGRERGDRRLVGLLAALLVASGSLALGALLVASPVAEGQGGSIQFTRFEPKPLVLPPSGGTLTVEVEARTDTATDVEVDVTATHLGPSCGATGTGSTQTAEPALLGFSHVDPSTGSNVLTGEVDVPFSEGEPHGWWRAEVAGVRDATGNSSEPLSPARSTTACFFIHPPTPVGGLEDAPWPQTGGDPGHSGRTVAVGPQPGSIDERWSFTSQDRQPFHEPVLSPDGRIYAVSWGGEVYSLTQEGQPLWTSPRDVGLSVAFPPALDASGRLLVASADGTLHAIARDRSTAWSLPLAEASGGTPLSPPVVGPDGYIHLVVEPWELVRVSPDGILLSRTPLEAPVGHPGDPGRFPVRVEGPPLAVTTSGQAVVAAGAGLAVVPFDGSPIQQIACNCTPRGVSLVPGEAVALVAAGQEVVAVSLADQRVLWSTDDPDRPSMGSTVWMAPTVGWGPQPLVYIPTEAGRLYLFTLEGGAHVSDRNLFQPLRGKPVVDANGNLYMGDACRLLLSIDFTARNRWTKSLDSEACNGLAAGPVVTRSGALLWPSPDGALRMLGANRLPVASFTVAWVGDGYLFDASGSRDPDGSPLTYAWDFGDGTTARGVRTEHSFQRSGEHTVKLIVSDGTSTASTSQQLDVNFPPQPVIVDESHGTTITLNASGSTDPEGDPISFNWTRGGEPVGSGPVLSFATSGTGVFPVTLSVDDGHHRAEQGYTALSPAREQWREVTLALYDGSCPSGLCSFPASLELVEGQLAEFLVVNGGTRTVEVTSPFEAVPGGTSRATVAPGGQENLHVRMGAPGSYQLTVLRPGTGGAPTQISVAVLPAPAEVTWRLSPPEGDTHVGRSATFTFHLEGPAPPETAELRLALRSGVEELTTRRASFPAGEPINASVPVSFTPRDTGFIQIRGVVESRTMHSAVVGQAQGDTALELEVLDPTLFSRIQAATAGNASLLAGLLLVTILAGGGAVAFAYLRRQRTEAQPGSTGAVLPDGDATVAGSFMPRKLDRFEIDRVLGEGGFGTTYLAQDTVLDRKVVLKEVKHVGHGKARDLLLHEARTAANLSHPNVVVVHDVIEEEGRLLLVMEYVKGGTLAERMEGAPLSVADTLGLFEDLLDGLSALHEAGIVHRDLKPTNILVTEDHVAKITDFGVAARVDGQDPEGDTFVGTPRYMAPEQLAGEPPGPAADVYAAGAVLYEMLSGEHHLGIPAGQTPDPADLLARRSKLPLSEVPGRVNEMLVQALDRDPAKRFASATELLAALREAFQSKTG